MFVNVCFSDPRRYILCGLPFRRHFPLLFLQLYAAPRPFFLQKQRSVGKLPMENTFTYGLPERSRALLWLGRPKVQGPSPSRLAVRLKKHGSFLWTDCCFFHLRAKDAKNQLQVRCPGKRAPQLREPVPMDLDILYEDTAPPGGKQARPHPSQGNHGNTLANGLADYFRKKQQVFRAVNRLDRHVRPSPGKTGCSLPSSGHRRSAGDCRAISGRCLWENRCLTDSSPSGGGSARAIHIPAPDHGEAASTRMNGFCIIKYWHLSLLRLRLETGRTHQIRSIS